MSYSIRSIVGGRARALAGALLVIAASCGVVAPASAQTGREHARAVAGNTPHDGRAGPPATGRSAMGQVVFAPRTAKAAMTPIALPGGPGAHPPGVHGAGLSRGPGPVPGWTDECEQVSKHTDADFSGGAFKIQGGFAQREVLAASYTIAATNFPIKINRLNAIFITRGATIPTTTQWSVLVWEGTPDTGALIAEYSSDDLLLPHIKMPPGDNGVNVEFSIDPGDPDQIIISDNGTRTFSVGFRIDKHQQQTADPCFVAPPTCCNAFPTVDVDGLSRPADNWLFAVDCGPLGCHAGWTRFSQFPSFCRPTGDWVLKAAWQPVDCQVGVGACCKPTGGCETMTVEACAAAGGTYKGDGVKCAAAACPEPTGACCIPATGGCAVVTESTCTSLAGQFKGGGSTCAACSACSANCNGDTDPVTGKPRLDILDFTCFQNKFAVGDPYANCNGDTLPGGGPKFDITDFVCFQNKFALGCP